MVGAAHETQLRDDGGADPHIAAPAGAAQGDDHSDDYSHDVEDSSPCLPVQRPLQRATKRKAGAQDDEVGDTAIVFSPHTSSRRASIVTPSAEVSGATEKKLQIKKHKLPRSFEGQPGPLTIQVPSENNADFSGPCSIIQDDDCVVMIRQRPMLFKVNNTSIMLEKERMELDNTIVGSVLLTQTCPTSIADEDKATINEFRFLLEWIIVVSIFY
jgi:hypothetical protein